MATAARLALPAWRNETCVRTFILRGIDVTGVSLRAQIRLGPDTPGAPLVSLDTVTTDGTQGLRVIGTPAAIDGVMTSTVRMTILNATMIDPAKIPPAAERGDNAVLAWALQINGATRLYGDFIVLAAVMDSDNAAAGAGAGSGGSGGSPWESATVTLIGETIEISLGDGAGVYGAITAERDRAIEAEGRKLDKAGGTMSGPIAMGGSRMTRRTDRRRRRRAQGLCRYRAGAGCQRRHCAGRADRPGGHSGDRGRGRGQGGGRWRFGRAGRPRADGLPTVGVADRLP